jgi:tetratricopeptide (TPR) repeat protein
MMGFISRLFESDAASHMARAEKYERLGKLGMARLELDQALEAIGLEDSAQREQINASIDRLTQLEKEDAASSARQALSSGDSKNARYHLNIALSKLDKESPAYQEYQRQLDAIPSSPEEDEMADDLDTLLRVETGVDFFERQRALEFWKSGFPPYKEDYYFRKALSSDLVREQAEQAERNPQDADACFNFGLTLAQLGLIDKATEQIQRFVTLKPEDRDAHYFLANLLADEGHDDEAIREFEKTINIDPDFVEAYFYLGVRYESLEDYERAEKCFRHVVANDTGRELADEARAKLESLRAKKSEPNSPDTKAP